MTAWAVLDAGRLIAAYPTLDEAGHVAEHYRAMGGQCEVRAMVLVRDLPLELPGDDPVAADLDELERRDSVSPQVAALWPETQCRSELEADG